MLAAPLHYPSWHPCLESRPQNSHCLKVYPAPAAVAVDPGSPLPASKPQGSHCLQTWVPRACSNCHGSWNHAPMQIDPRASAALWAPDNSSPLDLLTYGYPQLATQCQEPTTTHLSEPQALLFCWCQEASLPTEHGNPALPTVPDSKRALLPPSKSKNVRFPTKGKKAITCYSTGSTRSPIPPRYTEDQCFTLHLPAGESCLSCPRAGIPAPPLSGNMLL
jgi:hypothetical protein